jgi:hypothetical protein
LSAIYTPPLKIRKKKPTPPQTKQTKNQSMGTSFHPTPLKEHKHLKKKKITENVFV